MNWHPDHLLTPKEIHAAGGPAERTLERLRATGDGPRYVRMGPKVVRYRAADYLAWLTANTFAHAAEEHARRAAAAIPQTP
jgi:predicted DNA-binding transcriptional regulator AlpA